MVFSSCREISLLRVGNLIVQRPVEQWFVRYYSDLRFIFQVLRAEVRDTAPPPSIVNFPLRPSTGTHSLNSATTLFVVLCRGNLWCPVVFDFVLYYCPLVVVRVKAIKRGGCFGCSYAKNPRLAGPELVGFVRYDAGGSCNWRIMSYPKSRAELFYRFENQKILLLFLGHSLHFVYLVMPCRFGFYQMEKHVICSHCT